MELRTAKGRLFLLLLLIIFLPLLNHTFNIIESGKLLGVMVNHPDVSFTPAKWWDNSYQEQKTLYLNDSVSFRPDLVRMNDQIDFSLFKKLQGDDTYIGKDNYLFSAGYVNEYEGREYMGYGVIRDELIKLKLIQDTLEHMGKTFVFIYAPSKPYYLPEYIPNILRRNGARKTSNYETFRRIGDSLHIKQLDFNALFVAMRDTSKYSLFTKEGVHWSVYGSVLASDTLIKYIDRERKIKMPELVLTKMQISDTAREADNDLGKCTNLIFPMNKDKYYYPEYHYNVDSTKTKPKTIFIGDSFIWLWIGDGFIQNTTTNWEYWYYFNEVWDINGRKDENMSKYNWQKSLLAADCVVIEFTPINFPSLASKSEFIETIYSYFYPGKK